MADDLTKTGKPDDIRINQHQEHEMRYWAGKFGVTQQEVRDAITEVGPMVSNVRKRLKK